MLDDRFAIRPVQDLWDRVKNGHISEDDVDSCGKLKNISMHETYVDFDSLIRRYTNKLKCMDKSAVNSLPIPNFAPHASSTPLANPSILRKTGSIYESLHEHESFHESFHESLHESFHESLRDKMTDLNDLKVRLDALEKLVSSIIMSLRQAGISIVTNVYEEQVIS